MPTLSSDQHYPAAYQSSSSSFWFPAIAFCLALKASASPPAKLPPPILFGVALPESVPLPVPRLTALSLAGVGGGRGFLPPVAGLLTGGAGGVGLARVGGVGDGLRAAPFAVPFERVVAECVGIGRAGATGGGGGGGGARDCCSISSTYADGAQP